jgi:hypothetical protein
MKNVNWANVEENQEYKRLVPGGYVCGIVKVEDVEDKEYLKIYYDVTTGEFKGYFKELFDAKGFWGGNFIRSYKETALSFFKGFLTAIEKSNPNFTVSQFNNDISKLKGKLVGLVLGEEEYVSKDNEIKKRLYVAQVHGVEKIKANDFKVPELKKVELTTVSTADTTPADWDNVPF